jgi:hypothetical protein
MNENAQKNLERFQMIADRGLQDRLDDDKRWRFDKAVERGLVTLPENPKEARDSAALNTVREGLQGLTLGASDEAGAAVAALIATLKDGADFKEAYADILESVQNEQKAFRRDEPVLSTVAQIAGGAVTGGVGVQKALAKTAGKHIVKRGLAVSGAGAAEGGIAGYASNEGEDRGVGAVVGATVGALAAPTFAAGGHYLAKRSATKKAAEQVLKRRAAGEATDDVAAAGFKLNDKGKAVRDATQASLEKQGFKKQTISLITGSSKSDQKKYLKMLNTLQKSKSSARHAALNRTDDTVGEAIDARAKAIMRANRIAGRKIRKASEALEGQRLDFSKAANDFADDLHDLGITLDKKAGRVKPIFDNSVVEFNGASRRAITNVIKRIQSANVGENALDAHKLKQTIDDMVTYGKVKTGLSGRGENALKRLRHNLDAVLDDTFPDYKEANDLYSKTIKAIDDLSSAAGSKVSLADENADKALGGLARGLLSNNRGRQQLMNALDNLDKVAKELSGEDLGLKTARIGEAFDDDLVNLTVFAEALKDRFGAEASTSLAGETAKGAKAGIRAAMGDMSEAVASGIDKASEAVSGVNDEAAMDAMRQLLKELLK